MVASKMRRFPAIFLQALALMCVCAPLRLTQAAHVFDAYRLIQFDRDGEPFGSRRATVNHMAASIRQQVNAKVPADLIRTFVTVHFEDVSVEALQALIDVRKAAGVLIVLPVDEEAVPNPDQLHRFAQVESYLLSRAFDIPVFFAFNDANLHSIEQSLRSGVGAGASASAGGDGGGGDNYQFVLTGAEAASIASPALFNLQGSLHGALAAGAEPEQTGTIAIVADYDAFAAAPELAFGVDHNGSGTVALLEILRIFGLLYAEIRTHGNKNLLFLLTGGGRLNFAGTKAWLNSADPRALDAIEVAICLEALGAGDNLYLHVSKPPKTPEVSALYDTFTNTAATMNIPFEILHRKVNLSNPLVDFHHEQFSRKKIMAVTLSSNTKARPDLIAAGLFDRRPAVDVDILTRNIKYAAEVIARLVYKVPSTNTQLQIVADSTGVNPNAVNSWISFFSKQARFTPLMDKSSPVIVELEKALAKHAADVQKFTAPIDKHFHFFTSPKTQLSVYKVKPFMFDVYLAGSIVIYLGALYGALHYASERGWLPG